MSEPTTTLYIVASYMREGFGLPGKPSGSGGVFTQMAVLAKGLAQRSEYRVVLLTDEPFEYPGIEVRVVPPTPAGSPIPLLHRWRRRQHRRRLDALMNDEGRKVVLFPHSVKAAHLSSAGRVGAKTILWINADQLVDDTLIGRSQPTTRAVQDAIPKVDAVGVLNERQRRFVKERWGVEATLLTSGVEPPDPSLCEVAQDGFLWVGRLAPGKRPWMFAELARRFPGTRFRMVLRTRSTGSTAFEDYMDEEASRLPNLEIVRDVPALEMPQMYASARALVVTSASEGFPRVMTEAGAVGTEVLSFEINVDGLLDGPLWGYCAEGDLDAFIAKVGAIAAGPNPTVAERLAIRDQLLARCGSDRMIEDVDQLVKRLF